jgi:glycerophosphoryl diester phosphodiesterase
MDLSMGYYLKNKFTILFIISIGFLLQACYSNNESAIIPVTPLIRAHAHNDYRHPQPLFDALKFGFTSVEADIHLKNGKLYVAHDHWEITEDKTLQSLYLEPLRRLIEENGGSVFKNGPPLTLFIDIKTEADSTYQVLKEVLKIYKDALIIYEGDKKSNGAIEVIISGNRSAELKKVNKIMVAYYDGRLEDLGSSIPHQIIPIISENWTKHFQWRGKGQLPVKEKEKLRKIVSQAHTEGRRVRFWATDIESPEFQHNIWKELITADVDLINTDKLKVLRDFLLSYEHL